MSYLSYKFIVRIDTDFKNLQCGMANTVPAAPLHPVDFKLT